MIRILQIVEELNPNGTEAFLMNVFRNIDKSRIMFDFLVSRRTHSIIEEEALSLGACIYTFSSRRLGWKKHIDSLHKFYSSHRGVYRGVHIHGNSFTAMMPLAIASKYDIPVRIAHCHNTSTQGLHNKLLHNLNRLRVSRMATHYLACSESARIYGFKGTGAFSKSKVVNNGIELEKFRFNPISRSEKRKELGLTDELLIGNVAAFREAKNHFFMVDIMKEITQKLPDAKMIFVGKEGSLTPKVKSYVAQLGLTRNVLFTGARPDVPELLQAMDIFLFPSLYEGLGISVIEAETAGLPVFASTAVPPETDVTPLIKYLPLSLSAKDWADALLNCPIPDRNTEYDGLNKFDIKTTCEVLSNLYLS